MVLYKRIVTAVCVCVFSLTIPFLSSASAECFSTVWPHEKSDLQPDPSLVFGRLENGFRYILKKNSEPRDRVAMSLNIQAGSLYENSDQRGIAHFLEHMLFNGSTHFQPGELVEYFQSIGMSFGGDTNAHTGYDETVYDIILPQGNPDEIGKGLLVFSDYARGALLLQSEIDRERGVILAEKRSRDSAGYRAHVKETEFSMQGTMIPERMPIGILETLNRADHPLMKSFYDAWYRPENMVLVMVGDFEPKEIQLLVEKQFAGLAGSGDKPSCPELGRLQHDNAEFFYHHESDMGLTEVGIETLWNVEPEDDSVALEVKELTSYVARKIVQYRLDELARKSDTPFTSASIYSGIFLNQIAYAEIGAKCDADKWKESLLVIENSLRQALEFGFTEAELQRVKTELLAELDSAVLTANSRNSKKLASSIIRTLNNNRVMQSPGQEKELFGQVLIQMSLADVEKRFLQIWSQSNRLVKVNGNAVISEKDPLAVIKSSYGGATQKKVTAYRGETLKDFPYLHLKDKQPVVSQEHFADIAAKRFVFANGVVLNLKRTTFEENEIQISVDFGLGKSSEPMPGLSLLTESVIGQSGTATLSKNSLDRIISGSSVEIGFRVKPASFSWQGKALNKDMELLFQVLQSLLADPGVDVNAFQVSMDRYKQYYEGVAADVRGVMKLQGESFLAGGNRSFGLPPWAAFSQLNREQIQKWFLPASGNSALEVSLVGDFDEKEVLTLAENYFSVLPERIEKKMEEVTVSFPQGKTLALTIPSSIDKGMLAVAWKTDDFWDIQQTRGLHLLAKIFSDKMRRLIREKLGASYSPQVHNSSSRIYKDYGVMLAVLIVDPNQIAMLRKEVLSIAEEMWQGKISKEELDRAKGPMLTSLKDMVRTNRYWLNSVLVLSERYPQQLQWPLTILSGFEQFSLEEIRTLAKTYLAPDKAAVINVVPQ
jgi:zinc protease